MAENQEIQFQFPILEEPQLIDGLQNSLPEMGIGPEDFRNPKSERWQPFYFTILEYLVGVTPDQLNQMPLDLLQQLDDAEVHESSNHIFFLTLAMQRLMKACGVEDFKVRDVVEPKPRRMKRFVSALINFAHFKEQRMVFYDRIKDEEEVMLEQKESLLKENDELLRKINAIKAEHAEQEPEVLKHQDLIEQAEKAIGEKRRDVDMLQKTVNEHKASVKERNAKVAQLREAIASAKAERDRLSRQIVQSPERMRNEMERTERQVAALKQSKEELQARHMELQKQGEICKQQEADCEAGLKLIKAIQAEMEKDKELIGEWKKKQDQVQEKKDQLQDLNSSERQLKRQIATKQERLMKLKLQQDNKMGALMENLQQLKHKRELMQQQQSVEAHERRNVQEQLSQLLNADKIAVRDQEVKKAQMADKYSQMMEQLEDYHSKLAQTWESVKKELDTSQEF